MKVLQKQIEHIESMITDLTPYSHVDEKPWITAYKPYKGMGIAENELEGSMRTFKITVTNVEALPVLGLDVNRKKADCKIQVLYPLANDHTIAHEYFSEELSLLANLLESQSVIGDPLVRFVSFESSTIERISPAKLVFTHDFIMVFDEPNT